MSRLIAVEYKFTNGTPAAFRLPLAHPGFLPTGYRVLSLVYVDEGNDTGAVVLSHDRLGTLAIFDAGGATVGIGGRIDNHEEANLHSGSLGLFQVTQRGNVVATLDGTLTLLLECSRARAPHTH